MRRASHHTSTLAMTVICTVLWVCAMQGAAGSARLIRHSPKQTEDKTLVYYVFESFGGDNVTVANIAGPNGDVASMEFGHTSAFDNTIKDENSNVIGFAVGIATMSNHPRVFHISVTHSLNSKKLGVGTLEFSGKLDFSSLSVRLSEVVVSGGTGDFRFMRGVATIETVFTTGVYNTYKYTAMLRY